MRYLSIIISVIITLQIVASCSSNSESESSRGEEYTIFGMVWQDSLSKGSDMKVLVDKHGSFYEEDLPVLSGRFIFKNATYDADEVYLVDNLGRSVKVYAIGGAQIEVNIDSLYHASFIGPDSLNIQLRQAASVLDSLRNLPYVKEDSIKAFVNRVGEKYAGTLVPSLLVQERMRVINDSIFVRQFMGSLSDKSKPNWLVDNIELQFDNKGMRTKKNVRLSPLPKFATNVDTVIFDMKESRMNSNFLYFWAEYDSTSVDSLKMLEQIAKQFGMHQYADTYKSKGPNDRPKRIDINTICMYAKDSASWHKLIDKLPGTHILLQDGFANPVLKSWNVNRLPYNIIIDRFSNLQECYLWGKELREVLEKQPNNFSVKINNGSNSKNSRPSRN